MLIVYRLDPDCGSLRFLLEGCWLDSCNTQLDLVCSIDQDGSGEIQTWNLSNPAAFRSKEPRNRRKQDFFFFSPTESPFSMEFHSHFILLKKSRAFLLSMWMRLLCNCIRLIEPQLVLLRPAGCWTDYDVLNRRTLFIGRAHTQLGADKCVEHHFLYVTV